MTRLLFRIEWQQFRNKRSFGGGKNIVFGVIAAILGLVALAILGSIGFALGRFVGIEGVKPALSIVFLAAGVFILLFGIPQVFKNLFSSRDLELLFTMPISTRSIFWVKYAQSFFSIAGAIWLLVFIPFIAFGIGAGCSWLYYPVLFLVSAGVMVIAVSLAYLFNLGLIQILPASRTKELMTVMTAMAGILVYVLIQVPNFAMQGGLSSTGFTLPGLPVWLPTSTPSFMISGKAKKWCEKIRPSGAALDHMQ